MNNSMINRVGRILAVAGAGLCVGAGCVSTAGNAAYREANQREDSAIAQEKMRRLEGDMESLRIQTEQLHADLQRVQANSSRAADTQQISDLRSTLTRIEDRIDSLEAGRESDRRDIIDTVSRRVTELINASAAPPARTQSGGAATASGYGFEHVVQQGETLSRIAQAYGTTVKAIMEANNIQDANTLKVDRTLLIPR